MKIRIGNEKTNMSQVEFYNILGKYLAGESSRKEEKQFLELINNDEKLNREFEQIKKIWSAVSEEEKEEDWDVASAWKEAEKRMRFYDEPKASEPKAKKRRVDSKIYTMHSNQKSMMKMTLYSAAVLIIGLMTGLLFYISDWQNLEQNNGLNEAVVQKVFENERGEKSIIHLEDGSQIHLNSASQLIIDPKFNNKDRTVYLEGEAYFKVKSDSLPFNVISSGTVIEILGTAFNVRSYKSEPYSVIVSEGVVAVIAEDELDKSAGEILRRGNMLTRINGNFQVDENVDIGYHLAWTEQRLSFRDSPLSDVARTLERWYNIDIQFEDSELKEFRVTASFENEPMYEVLRTLDRSLNISHEIEDKQLKFFVNESTEN